MGSIVKAGSTSGDFSVLDPNIGVNLPCNYQVLANSVVVTIGIRKTPFGNVIVPSRTLAVSANFAAFDDVSEAGVFATAGFLYMYVKMSDPTKMALSRNSPYDKNGGVSNVALISGSYWVYLGSAKWFGSSFSTGYTSGSKFYYTQSSAGAQFAGQTSLSGTTNLAQNGMFGSFLPGASTNTRSRIASEVQVVAQGGWNHRNDSGNMFFHNLGISFGDQGQICNLTHYIKTPFGAGSSYYAVFARQLNVIANTLYGTDTATATWDTAAQSNVGDGNCNLYGFVQWFVDQYIFI